MVYQKYCVAEDCDVAELVRLGGGSGGCRLLLFWPEKCYSIASDFWFVISFYISVQFCDVNSSRAKYTAL